MKRRTLDVLFSIGGVGLAVLLFVVGVVLTSNANFAKTYVRDQLSDQKITFKEAAALTDEEKAKPCLVQYAGQALTTGKQAECYANSFIALHVDTAAKGRTYSQLGEDQAALRTQIADATKAGSPNVAALQKQLTDLTTTRETVFKGEALRSMLLTSYGFSVFGVKGSQVASIAYIVAGLLFLLSLAGFAHALRTPKDKLFAAPDFYEADLEELARI